MPSNEEQIRNLIERWAEAVHAGDLPIVVANHADDIVMYDVPSAAPRRPRDRRVPGHLAGLRVAAHGRVVRDRVAGRRRR